MWRVLRHSTLVLCFLLALAAGAFTLRSLWVSHSFGYYDEQRQSDYAIHFIRGKMIVDHLRSNIPSPNTGFYVGCNGRPTGQYAESIKQEVRLNGGFEAAGIFAYRSSYAFALVIPEWAIAAFVLGSLLAAASDLYVVMRRRSVSRRSVCPQCHYDLRASTATCPECGTPIDRPIDKLPA